MTFFELANIETREDLTSIFGVSAPTLQRWVSSGEYPKYVDIILSLHENIKKLENSNKTKDFIYKDLISRIRIYKVSQDDLFSVIP